MPFCSTASIASRDDAVLVEQLVALLGDQQRRSVCATVILRGLVRPAERLAEHVAEIEHAHLGARHAGNVEGRQRRPPPSWTCTSISRVV